MSDEHLDVLVGGTVFHSPQTYGTSSRLRRDLMYSSRCGHGRGNIVDAGDAIRSGLTACKRCFPYDPTETWDIDALTEENKCNSISPETHQRCDLDKGHARAHTHREGSYSSVSWSHTVEKDNK